MARWLPRERAQGETTCPSEEGELSLLPYYVEKEKWWRGKHWQRASEGGGVEGSRGLVFAREGKGCRIKTV